MKLLRNSVFFCFGVIVFITWLSPALSQTIRISPEDTLYFGRIPEGKVAVRNVTVYNLSTTTLNISDFRVEGPGASQFTIPNDPGTVSLGISQKTILDVQYQPVSEGFSSAQLVVESNAGTSPDQIELTGYGTDLNSGIIVFERIFGETKSDGAGSVRLTTDGGFILAGGTRQVEREYGDATLIKLDAYGQTEWRQIYGIEDWSESLSEVIPTNDGGYIAVGTKAHSDKSIPSDVWIVKTDDSGTVEWDTTCGSSEEDHASSVIQTSDGGYLISGSYQHDTAQRQDTDAYLIKLNADRSLAWEKQYGGLNGESAGTVLETTDGGYLFSGRTSSYGSGEWDVYLVKVQTNGTEDWHKEYGGSDWDYGGRLVATSDGGYLIAGWTANFGVQARDIYLVKVNSAGTEQWYKTFGDVHKDQTGEIIQTGDGGFLIVGNTENTFYLNNWRSDGYIIKTDGSGNEVWSQVYGGISEESFSCVRDVGDGGYIVSGSANSYGNESEIYLLKIDAEGGFTSVFDDRINSPESFALAQNYPNPFNSETWIRFDLVKNSHVDLQVYNVHGQLVETLINAYRTSGSHSIHFDAEGLSSGLYFYQIKVDGLTETRRMLHLK